jgi:hypothetical protein
MEWKDDSSLLTKDLAEEESPGFDDVAKVVVLLGGIPHFLSMAVCGI